MTLLLLALAGGLGACCRFLLDGLVRSVARVGFPLGTFLVNLTGSFLLGVLSGALLTHTAPDGLRLVLGTGFFGGYTTFSTASLEAVRLLTDRRWGALVSYALGTLVTTVAAAIGGLALGAAL